MSMEKLEPVQLELGKRAEYCLIASLFIIDGGIETQDVEESISKQKIVAL